MRFQPPRLVGWSIFVAVVIAILWYATANFIANDASPDVERFINVAERLNPVLKWELVIVIALVILAAAFTINLVLLLAGASFVGKNEFAQIVDTIWKCCKNVGDKFKQLRTTAVVFGVLLTVIILSLLNSDVLKQEQGKEVPDAFWIAFGVVLSAFATAIANLVEKDDQPEKDGQTEGDDTKLDEVIRTIVAQEIRSASDTSRSQREPDPSPRLPENREGEIQPDAEGNDSEPRDGDEQARA